MSEGCANVRAISLSKRVPGVSATGARYLQHGTSLNNYVSIDWAQPKVLAPCLPPKNGSKKGHKNGGASGAIVSLSSHALAFLAFTVYGTQL